MCGSTGFAAGLSHAPTLYKGASGLERYLFIVGPHIAISADGEIGKVERVGRDGLSGACGAMIAFAGEIAGGTPRVLAPTVYLFSSLISASQYLISHWW